MVLGVHVEVGEDISFCFLSSQGPFHLSVPLLFLLLLFFFLLFFLLSLPFFFYHPLWVQDNNKTISVIIKSVRDYFQNLFKALTCCWFGFVVVYVNRPFTSSSSFLFCAASSLSHFNRNSSWASLSRSSHCSCSRNLRRGDGQPRCGFIQHHMKHFCNLCSLKGTYSCLHLYRSNS